MGLTGNAGGLEKYRLRQERKEAEGRAGNNAAGQGNVNLWCQVQYLHLGQLSGSLGWEWRSCQRRTFQSTHFKDNAQNPVKSHRLVKSPPWNFRPSKPDSLLCQCILVAPRGDLEPPCPSFRAALSPDHQRKRISAECLAGRRAGAML